MNRPYVCAIQVRIATAGAIAYDQTRIKNNKSGLWYEQMKRIIRWLESKISRPKNPIVADQPSDPVSVESDDIANDDDYEIETSFDAEVPPDS